MEYYTADRKHDIKKFVRKWVELEKKYPEWGIPESERWMNMVCICEWILSKTMKTKL